MICFIISLFPLHNSPEYIAEEDFKFNQNIFMGFSWLYYLRKDIGSFFFEGGLSSPIVIVVLGAFVIAIFLVILIINIVKGIKSLKLRKSIAQRYYRKAIKWFGIIGIVAIVSAFANNGYIKAMAYKSVDVNNSSYNKLSGEEKERADKIIKEKREKAMESAEPFLYGFSVPALLLIIVSFCGLRYCDKVDIKRDEEFNEDKIHHTYHQYAEGSWKCEQCGYVNESKHTVCVKCYSRRE